MQKKEEEDKTRFLNLSDREKRAIAAERRILAQNEALPSAPRSVTSWSFSLDGS